MSTLDHPSAARDTGRVLSDRIYRAVGGQLYLLDVHMPRDDGGGARPVVARPVVVLVHGQARPDLMRDAKGWPELQGLARVLADKGMVAVVPNLGSSAGGPGLVADNVVSAVRHVEAHADELGADARRMALWVVAEGGLYGLGPALGGELDPVRCAVALHPLLSERRLAATQPPLTASLRDRLWPSGHVRRRGRRLFPLMVVRADQDQDDVNQALDEFVNLAQQVEVPITLLRHDQGRPGFEAAHSTGEARAVLDRAVAFLERHL